MLELCHLFLTFFLLMVSSSLTLAQLPTQLEYQTAVSKLTPPAGYTVSLFAVVPGARSMTQAKDGTLFVGTGGFSNPYQRVYRIKDWNKNSKIDPDEVEIFIDGLNNPNGVAVRKESLYVAEVSRILVFDKVLSAQRGTRVDPKSGRALPQKFPSDPHHGWKFVRFAPPPNDNWLYVPVGAHCNVCDREAPYSSIYKINVDGTEAVRVARGVRNSVGFDFHPGTQRLWFTDNGRDLLGDTVPGDELNELTAEGENFGFPYCHQGDIVDPEFKKFSCRRFVRPRLVLTAHAAALGMRFFNDQIIIAEHGSWNRSKKVGYQVSVVTGLPGARGQGSELKREDLVTGWLNSKDQAVWGRPVDIEVQSNRTILISDDGVPGSKFSGAIYKLERKMN